MSLRERLKTLFQPKAPAKEDEGPERELDMERTEEARPATVYPIRVERSVTRDEARRARDELRALNVEREIVSFALTHLYEAEADGKITEAERAQLVDRYRRSMRGLERQIERNQLIVDLHELEGAQDDLVKTFHAKLQELGRRVEGMRSALGVAVKEAPPPTVPPQPEPPSKPPKVKEEEKEEKKEEDEGGRRRPRRRTKTEAEERIEAIQEEVLKVLERLEQIETQG